MRALDAPMGMDARTKQELLGAGWTASTMSPEPGVATEVTPRMIEALVIAWCRADEHMGYPGSLSLGACEGLYWCREADGGVTAVDNTSGACLVEGFASPTGAVGWLLGAGLPCEQGRPIAAPSQEEPEEALEGLGNALTTQRRGRAMSERGLYRLSGGRDLPFVDEDDLWSALDMMCDAATEHGHIARFIEPGGRSSEIALFDGSGPTLQGFAWERGLVLWRAAEDDGELVCEFRASAAPDDPTHERLVAEVRPVGEALFEWLRAQGAPWRDRDRDGLLWGAWRECGPAYLNDTAFHDRYRNGRSAMVAHVTDCVTAEDLRRWFDQRDECLMASAKDWPACWGGQFRVDDFGHYVPADVFEAALPTYGERQVWLAIANGAVAYLDEALFHVHRWRDELDVGDGELVDIAWFEEAVDEALEDPNCPCFYTEASVHDFSDEEIEALLEERPDLAEQEPLAASAREAKPLRETWGTSQEKEAGRHGRPRGHHN